jgi:hypothetical protein
MLAVVCLEAERRVDRDCLSIVGVDIQHGYWRTLLCKMVQAGNSEFVPETLARG